jgi:hypothetical protein
VRVGILDDSSLVGECLSVIYSEISFDAYLLTQNNIVLKTMIYE